MNTKNSTLKRVGIILLVSGVLAILANVIRPNKIPWVQDWSSHVEGRAKKKEIRVIPLSLAHEKFQTRKSVFIDARPALEFEAGHIPGAVSIPLALIDERFEAIGLLIDSGREFIVYCSNRQCDDALMLAISLKTMGVSNPLLLIDGFEAWEQIGASVETGP